MDVEKPIFQRIPWSALIFYGGMAMVNMGIMYILSSYLHLVSIVAIVLVFDLIVCTIIAYKTEGIKPQHSNKTKKK